MWMNSFLLLEIGIFLEPCLFQKIKGLICKWKEGVAAAVWVDEVVEMESSSSSLAEEGRRWR